MTVDPGRRCLSRAPSWPALLICLGVLAGPGGAIAQSNPWPDDDAAIEQPPAVGDAQVEVKTPPAPPVSPPDEPTQHPDERPYIATWWSLPRWSAPLIGVLVAYFLGLLLFHPLLVRGWSPSGGAFLSLFLAGLLVSLFMPYLFARQIYVDGQPLGWWQQSDAWLWALPGLGFLILLGFFAFLARPAPRAREESSR